MMTMMMYFFTKTTILLLHRNQDLIYQIIVYIMQLKDKSSLVMAGMTLVNIIGTMNMMMLMSCHMAISYMLLFFDSIHGSSQTFFWFNANMFNLKSH